MLTLRLQRLGKTKRPTYRLIVSEKRHDTQYGSLEILGTYNPVQNPPEIKFNKERIEYWLSVGAQTSPTVNNLLVAQGIVKGKKEKSVFLSQKRQAKLAKAAEAKAKAAEAKSKEAASAAPAAESASEPAA